LLVKSIKTEPQQCMIVPFHEVSQELDNILFLFIVQLAKNMLNFGFIFPIVECFPKRVLKKMFIFPTPI